MEIVKEWVSNIFMIIISITFIEILLPDSSLGKYIKFVLSLVVMATVLYPVISLINEYP